MCVVVLLDHTGTFIITNKQHLIRLSVGKKVRFLQRLADIGDSFLGAY